MHAKKKQALEAKLDARQQKAAFLLVENEMRETGEKRTQEEIAEEIGVSFKTLWTWKKKNDAFIEYKNAISDDFLKEQQAFVYSQLMKLIGGSQPSVKAIDLWMRRHGLLTDKTVTETINNDSERSNDDLQRELAEVEELLKKDD
jgi:transcriptional regulator with XRE-family HTH domain